MVKIVIVLLILFNIFISQATSQENFPDTVVCLYKFNTPPGANLEHIKEAIKNSIINRLNYIMFGIKIYFDNDIIKEHLKEPENLLKADKVQLMQIRRETGFDGVIFGDIDQNQNNLIITIHFVDFFSGRLYSTGRLEGSFGSNLIRQIEEKVDLFSNSLKSYDNCILDIISEPGEAEVFINGNKVGNTPLMDFNLRYGEVFLEIKKQDYIPYKANIELKPGQRFMLHALLNRYSITATSYPDNTYILIDGQIIGTTPVKDMAIEQPQFTIEFTKDGFAPHKELISLAPGQKAYIHANLFDIPSYRMKNKKSIWEIDAHNFCLNQTLNIQNLDKINVNAFPISNFRYYAKFNRIIAGFGLGVGYINASNYFDTFLGPKGGYEKFTLEILKGSVFAHYNIIEKLNKLEVYLGTFSGFSSTRSSLSYPTYYYYESYIPADYSELKNLNPLWGGEVGINTYISGIVKVSISAGSYYAGEIEYPIKKVSYWGVAKYESGKVSLRPFYVGLSVTLSIMP